MERLTRIRAGIVLAFFALVVGIFALRLYNLQLIENDSTVDNTKTFTTITTVKAARGEILDCNGNVLVTNRASYDLVFNHYVICSASDTNGRLLELVRMCRELDIEYKENFPVTEDSPFEYTLGEYSSALQGYFQSYLSKKAKLDSDITAPLLMKKLRALYKIPEDWSDADARAVIGLRYELDLRQDITNLPNYVFLEDASTDALAAILELNTPGLNAEASVVRVYNTKYAAHILGYVGAMTSKQWEKYKDLTYLDQAGESRALYNMDALVGQSGLEEAFEEYLHGIDGIRVDVTYTDGTIKESYYKVEPQAGKNVALSIDLNLQMAAEENLESLILDLRSAGEGLEEGAELPDGADAEGGAVVVMNVKTGQVLACASYPTYDLSTFREDYNELLVTDYSPLYNRALQATYPPGSTYKMSMVVAGIDSGTITKDTLVYDEGVYREYESSGFHPECLQYTNYGYGHGWVNAAMALRSSCNYYFYYLGDKMDIEVMDYTARMLGLGEYTGVELYEEPGHRANRETKAKLHTGDDARWYIADQITAAIGQSENKFSPIQLCVYASTLANRGVRYQATFLNRVIESDYSDILFSYEPSVLSTLTISDQAFAAYTEGMKLVASEGTAAKVFKNYPISVAAKTGTAETESGGSDNGSFVCYAPADEPEIAVVVYVEKGGHGSTVAAVGKAVLDEYFSDILSGDTTVGENEIG